MPGLRALLAALAAAVCLALPALAQEPVQAFPLPRSAGLAPANLAGKIETLRARLAKARPDSPQARQAALGLGLCLAMNRQNAEAEALLAPLAGQAAAPSPWPANRASAPSSDQASALDAGSAALPGNPLADPADAGQSLEAPGASPPLMAGWAGLYLGLARFRSGDYAAALERFAALADGPANFTSRDAQLLAGYCLEGLGDPARALVRYRRFLDQGDDPLRAVGLWRGTVCAAGTGDYPAAESFLRELLQGQPWTASAGKAEALARDLADQGRIAFRPDAAANLAERAQVLLDRSQTAKAMPLIDRLAQAPDADPARVLYLKGKALYARRETSAALRAFEDILQRHPDWEEAPWALYHQARCLWRSGSPEDFGRMSDLLARALARGRGRPDLEAACRRLILLSNLERGRLDQALGTAGEIARTVGPDAEITRQAAWLSGLIRLAQYDPDGALADLSRFAAANPQEEYQPGVSYWLGRARQVGNEADKARELYRRVAAGWPNTYYAVLAARRLAALGEAAPPIPDGGLCAPSEAAVGDPASAREIALGLARADVLESCLLPEAAERELAPLTVRFPRERGLALRYARVATGLGNHVQAVRAASRAFGDCLAKGSARDLAPLKDIFYPRRYADLLARNLAGGPVGLDLACALIRQESFFEPEAVSGAGAVGLMQVMPATARSLAAKAGDKNFRAETLKDPAVNIRFGVRFLLERFEEYGGSPEFTLASYNAGRVKLRVWIDNLGQLDPDLFTEFIPYTETRDYVKRILANQAMYRRLY